MEFAEHTDKWDEEEDEDDDSKDAIFNNRALPPLFDRDAPLRPALIPGGEGPLSLPSPLDMPETVVQRAHDVWAAEQYWSEQWKWRDSSTLEYVRFATCVAHGNKDLKKVALRLIGRMREDRKLLISQANKFIVILVVFSVYNRAADF